MPFLTDWKATKKNFEAKTKKKKPSEKFLGAFGKSSGIETALKALDVAIAKKTPQLLPKLVSNWEKVYHAYQKTMEAAIKKENSPAYSMDVTNILGVFLSSVRHEVVRQESALWTDDDTVMTFEEAVGTTLFSDVIQHDPIHRSKDLQVWMADLGGIRVGSTAAVDQASALLTAKARKHFKVRQQLLKIWAGLRSKTMKRGVAINKACEIQVKIDDSWNAMAGGIVAQIGEWTHAQSDFIIELGRSNDPPLSDKDIKADIADWQGNSPAWKAIKKIEPLHSAAADYNQRLARGFKLIGRNI